MFEKLQKPAIWLALLGVLKLVTEAFGFNLIDDSKVNVIADGLAAILTVVGTAINHGKPKEEAQPEIHHTNSSR